MGLKRLIASTPGDYVLLTLKRVGGGMMNIGALYSYETVGVFGVTLTVAKTQAVADRGCSATPPAPDDSDYLHMPGPTFELL